MANQTINQITKFIGRNEKLFWGVLALLAIVFFMNPTGTAEVATQSILGLDIASETVIIFAGLTFIMGGGLMLFASKWAAPKSKTRMILVGGAIALISFFVGGSAVIEWLNNMVSGYRIGTWVMVGVPVLAAVFWVKSVGIKK